MPQFGASVSRILIPVAFSVLLVAALVVEGLVFLPANANKVLNPHYYMALGNSLSFGYQPNLEFGSGFADDIFNDMVNAHANVTEVINFACAGETTTTMLEGGCVARYAHKGSYTGPQILAATNFLRNPHNKGRISPITLEIGANDVLPDFDSATCTANAHVATDLATMDDNLTRVILPDLVDALKTPNGANTGDLHLLNFYNPFAKQCPNSAQFIHELNDHLKADAATYRIAVVDVYAAFGGDMGMAGSVCKLTWMCDAQFHDIHPNNAGYLTIARTVESALGLPNPVAPKGPSLAPPLVSAPSHVAALWRRPDAALVG